MLNVYTKYGITGVNLSYKKHDYNSYFTGSEMYGLTIWKQKNQKADTRVEKSFKMWTATWLYCKANNRKASMG